MEANYAPDICPKRHPTNQSTYCPLCQSWERGHNPLQLYLHVTALEAHGWHLICAEMVQAMGEGLNLQTGLSGQAFSTAEEDGFSSDSDYHEQLLFDEEPIKTHPISGAEANPGPAAPGLL